MKNEMTHGELEAVIGGSLGIDLIVKGAYELFKEAASAVYEWSTKADHSPYTRGDE